MKYKLCNHCGFIEWKEDNLQYDNCPICGKNNWVQKEINK